MATTDPGPAVKGRGIRHLRAAGITVETGLMKDKASEVLAPYATRIRLQRPFVIAKWAQSLDGKLATRTGNSRWISCKASRRLVHRLRARVDAIIVGSGTVAADNPTLTARGVPIRRKALRIVLDSRLQLSERCQLVTTCRAAPLAVMTATARAGTPKARRLRQKGVEVIACRSRGGRLGLSNCLRLLADREITNVLVEGGPTVLTALFEAKLVDEAFVFISPMLIGGRDAPTALGGRGVARVDAALEPRLVQTRRSGRDRLYRLRFS